MSVILGLRRHGKKVPSSPATAPPIVEDTGGGKAPPIGLSLPRLHMNMLEVCSSSKPSFLPSYLPIFLSSFLSVTNPPSFLSIMVLSFHSSIRPFFLSSLGQVELARQRAGAWWGRRRGHVHQVFLSTFLPTYSSFLFFSVPLFFFLPSFLSSYILTYPSLFLFFLSFLPTSSFLSSH
jgi:hypothetical protein